MTGSQQRLAGYACPIRTFAADEFALDDRDTQAGSPGALGGVLPDRAGAEHDDVAVLFGSERGLSASRSASWRRSSTTRSGCGRSSTGSGGLPQRVIRAVLKPTFCAPSRSHTCAATIMHSVGAIASSWHTYR